MEKRKSINEQISRFQKLESSPEPIEEKLNELLQLLETTNLDSATVSLIQNKFNNAIEQSKISSESIKLFQQLDKDGASRLELADNLEDLLTQYELDSKISKKFILADRIIKIVRLIAAVVLIALGFAMIVMPATPAFEMYTIFYLTADDGVTLMDLIALLVVLAGVYLFTTSLVKMNRQE